MAKGAKRRSSASSCMSAFASTSLIDALSVASVRLEEQKLHLQSAQGSLQNPPPQASRESIHRKADRYHWAVNRAVKSWQSATQIYADIFESLLNSTAAEFPANGDYAKTHLAAIQKLADSATMALRAAKQCPLVDDVDQSAKKKRSGAGSQTVAGLSGSKKSAKLKAIAQAHDTLQKKGKESYDGSGPDPQGIEPSQKDDKKKGRKSLKSNFRDREPPTGQIDSSNLASTQPVEDETSTEQANQSPLAGHSGAGSMQSPASQGDTIVPQIEYEDVSAEVEARMQAKAEKKAKEKGEKKRKRDRPMSALEALEAAVQDNQPDMKKIKTEKAISEPMLKPAEQKKHEREEGDSVEGFGSTKRLKVE